MITSLSGSGGGGGLEQLGKYECCVSTRRRQRRRAIDIQTE